MTRSTKTHLQNPTELQNPLVIFVFSVCTLHYHFQAHPGRGQWLKYEILSHRPPSLFCLTDTCPQRREKSQTDSSHTTTLLLAKPFCRGRPIWGQDRRLCSPVCDCRPLQWGSLLQRPLVSHPEKSQKALLRAAALVLEPEEGAWGYRQGFTAAVLAPCGHQTLLSPQLRAHLGGGSPGGKGRGAG